MDVDVDDKRLSVGRRLTLQRRGSCTGLCFHRIHADSWDIFLPHFGFWCCCNRIDRSRKYGVSLRPQQERTPQVCQIKRQNELQELWRPLDIPGIHRGMVWNSYRRGQTLQCRGGCRMISIYIPPFGRSFNIPKLIIVVNDGIDQWHAWHGHEKIVDNREGPEDLTPTLNVWQERPGGKETRK